MTAPSADHPLSSGRANRWRLQRRCNRTATAPSSVTPEQHPPRMPDRGRPDMTTDQATRTDEATEETAPPIDMDTLMAFVGQVVGDLGATMAAGNIVVGDRLGLYKALSEGRTDARGLAAAT